MLAPGRRSFSLRAQLRSEQLWARVVLLVGGAGSLLGSWRWGDPDVAVVVDDGTGTLAVPPVRATSAAERAGARRSLGVSADAAVWCPAGAVEDRALTLAELRRVAPDGVVVAPLGGGPEDPEQLAVWRAAADVAVATAASVRVPRDLLIAAWSGLPLVAPVHGAFAELVDERTGATVDPGDPSFVDELAVVVADRAARGAAAADRVRTWADPERWLGAWTRRCASAVP